MGVGEGLMRALGWIYCVACLCPSAFQNAGTLPKYWHMRADFLGCDPQTWLLLQPVEGVLL